MLYHEDPIFRYLVPFRHVVHRPHLQYGPYWARYRGGARRVYLQGTYQEGTYGPQDPIYSHMALYMVNMALFEVNMAHLEVNMALFDPI